MINQRQHNSKTGKDAKLLVICFPYAGGSGFAFQQLKDFWPKSWDIKTITYPGRGHKIEDPLIYKVEDLVNYCWEQIKDWLHRPYIFFGHSLGGRLIYLLAHKIREQHKKLPECLVISGTHGASVPPKQPYRYAMPTPDLKAILKRYGAIPEEIVQDEFAFNFFEPIIRADFQVAETWQYTPREKLPIPTMVVTGTEEDMTEAEILLWEKEFSTTINFRQLTGHHFFLFDSPKQMIKLIEEQVNSVSITKSNGRLGVVS